MEFSSICQPPILPALDITLPSNLHSLLIGSSENTISLSTSANTPECLVPSADVRQSLPCSIPVSNVVPSELTVFVPENILGVTIYSSPNSVA